MIRYSLEYVLFGLDAAARANVIAQTQSGLAGRTKGGSINTLDAEYEYAPGVIIAFCEVNEFSTKADGDQIFDVLRSRAAASGATNYSRLQSYVRLTEVDDVARTRITRITRSPSWPDDPGTLTNL